MHYFWSNFKLQNVSVGIKIIVTFFNLIMCAGLASNLAIFYLHTQFRSRAIVTYYLGSEQEWVAPQSFRALLETSHFHIFSMPVVIMIMAHLLLMTSVREWLKLTVISASFVGTLLEIASPWLIRYVSGQCAILMILAQILLALSFSFYIFIPIHEMWFKKRNAQALAEAELSHTYVGTIRREP